MLIACQDKIIRIFQEENFIRTPRRNEIAAYNVQRDAISQHWGTNNEYTHKYYVLHDEYILDSTYFFLAEWNEYNWRIHIITKTQTREKLCNDNLHFTYW